MGKPPPSRYGTPHGPRPFNMAVLVMGGFLLAWSYLEPSLHALWAVPLGIALIVVSLGWMFSR